MTYRPIALNTYTYNTQILNGKLLFEYNTDMRKNFIKLYIYIYIYIFEHTVDIMIISYYIERLKRKLIKQA